MMLHKVSARRDRTWDRRPYCIANSLTKCLPCELWQNSAQTHSHLGIGMRKKSERTKRIKREAGERLSLARMQPFAWEKKRFLWHSKCVGITWPWHRPWHSARLGTMLCKFGRDPAICLVEEAICAKCLQTGAARWHSVNVKIKLPPFCGQRTVHGVGPYLWNDCK